MPNHRIFLNVGAFGLVVVTGLIFGEDTGLLFRKFCVLLLNMLVLKHISKICAISSGSANALEFLTTVHFCHLSCFHTSLIGFQITFSLAVIHKEYREKYAQQFESDLFRLVFNSDLLLLDNF